MIQGCACEGPVGVRVHVTGLLVHESGLPELCM